MRKETITPIGSFILGDVSTFMFYESDAKRTAGAERVLFGCFKRSISASCALTSLEQICVTRNVTFTSLEKICVTRNITFTPLLTNLRLRSHLPRCHTQISPIESDRHSGPQHHYGVIIVLTINI